MKMMFPIAEIQDIFTNEEKETLEISSISSFSLADLFQRWSSVKKNS